MFRKMAFLAVPIVLAMAFVSTAWADDLNPPPWRGIGNWTYAQWLFNSPSDPARADQYVNPFGEPIADVEPNQGSSWLQEYMGRQGVWPLSGSVTARINNYQLLENPYKEVWVQITWFPQPGGLKPIIVKDLMSGAYGTIVNEMQLSDDWWHSTYLITIIPNPTSEEIFIEGDVYLDQLVIDTRCVPEPSSIMALAGCALTLLGFGLRRK